jgi:hypothetical protein
MNQHIIANTIPAQNFMEKGVRFLWIFGEYVGGEGALALVDKVDCLGQGIDC